MPIYIIAALDENRVIGYQGRLPWHLPDDLKRFRELTTGNVVVMGRKTYESIISFLGHPLKDRLNVVLTTDKNYNPQFSDVLVYNNLDDVISDFKDKTVFVSGGASIYRQAIDKADKMYLTFVKGVHEGDVYFPEFDRDMWEETGREDYDKFSFVELTRKYEKRQDYSV